MTKPIDIAIRVSKLGGRTGPSYQSPFEQERDCRDALQKRSLRAGQVLLEDDASGRIPIADRAAGRILERVRTGQSGGLAAAYLDRTTRRGAREALGPAARRPKPGIRRPGGRTWRAAQTYWAGRVTIWRTL